MNPVNSISCPMLSIFSSIVSLLPVSFRHWYNSSIYIPSSHGNFAYNLPEHPCQSLLVAKVYGVKFTCAQVAAQQPAQS